MNKRRLVKVFIILLLISIMTMLFLYFKDARVKKYMLNNNKFDVIDIDNYEVFLLVKHIRWLKVMNLKRSFFLI